MTFHTDAELGRLKAENAKLRALLMAWSHFTDETIDAELLKLTKLVTAKDDISKRHAATDQFGEWKDKP